MQFNVDSNCVASAMRGKVPAEDISQLINKSIHSNEHSDVTAYIMSCFSEIAYLHIHKAEIKEKNRYRIFSESILHDFILKQNIIIDINEVFRLLADIDVSIIETDNFVYVIGKFKKFYIVSVRGTRLFSLSDWFINFSCNKVSGYYGKYHKGFYDEAKKAVSLLKSEIKKDIPLYFTGHSLGGAVAAILSKCWNEESLSECWEWSTAILSECSNEESLSKCWEGDTAISSKCSNGEKKVRTPYLFASPRFADHSAAKNFKAYSYICSTDIIPHLPPKIFDFSDLGSERFILPKNAKKAGYLKCLPYSIASLFGNHKIERYRRYTGEIIGEIIGEKYSDDAYIQALKKIL